MKKSKKSLSPIVVEEIKDFSSEDEAFAIFYRTNECCCSCYSTWDQNLQTNSKVIIRDPEPQEQLEQKAEEEDSDYKCKGKKIKSPLLNLLEIPLPLL